MLSDFLDLSYSRLPCVILQHTQADNSHLDWMIETDCHARPDPDRKSLLAFRLTPLTPPPTHWTHETRLHLLALPRHRRAYLQHQGATRSGVGSVIRLDAGHVHPERLGLSRCLLWLTLRTWQGRILLHRHAPAAWSGRVIAYRF